MIPLAMLPWGKIAGALAIAAAVGGAHYLYSSHYVEKGRAEVMADWNAQKVVDREALIKSIEAARLAEQTLAAGDVKAAELRIMGIENENKRLASQLADRKPGVMRTYTVEAVRPGTADDEGKQNGSGPDATCRAKLPREIGEGYERLREDALRIGSDANKAAITLAGCQERVERLENAINSQ